MTRLVRFLDAQGQLRLGAWLDDGRVQPLRGSLLGEREAAGAPVPLDTVTLLAPVVPSKVVALASNYRDHAAEMGKPLPEVPKLFIKPSTSVIGPDVAIELPPGAERIDHEAELAVVIGHTMQRVAPEDALGHVLGYTCLNDVTARDFQKADGQFTRAKGFDTFCPLGPCIRLAEPGLDPGSLRVACRVDGVVRQDGSTRDMVFDVPTMLSFISHVMTLLPGDVVATGTPAGVGPLAAGQVVEVEIEGVGLLRNPVRSRADRNG